jgi:hypothetical protein
MSPVEASLVGLVASLVCAACGSTAATSPARAGSATDAGRADAGIYPTDAPQPSPTSLDASDYPVDASQPDRQEASDYPVDASQPDSTRQEASDNPSDAARPDASVYPAGASQSDAGTCNGTFVCDDFESYAVGAAPAGPWTVAKNLGTVAVDATRSHSGTRSVKVTAPAATGYRSVMLRIAGAGLLPVAGNAFYGRMMFWLDSSPSTSVHWTFVDGSGLVAGTAYHAVYRYGGQLPLTDADGGFLGSQLMASYDTVDSYTGVGPATDCYQHSHGRPVPVGAWSCVEWQFDGPNDTTRFWLDGQPVPDLTVSHKGAGCVSQPSTYEWTSPTISQADVGWESYQADGARTMWIDDVAFGAARIGCP